MTSAYKTPSVLPDGVWQVLLPHAYTLIDQISAHGIPDPFWTFGGGTVLMLRWGHRMSKDIDIFVPDPPPRWPLQIPPPVASQTPPWQDSQIMTNRQFWRCA